MTSCKKKTFLKTVLYIQFGSKVVVQYIVNFCIPTFGPPCIYYNSEIANGTQPQ